MVCMTLNCVGLTQSSVTWIIYCDVGLKFLRAKAATAFSVS